MRNREVGQGWGSSQLQSNQPELADLVFRALDLKGQLPLDLDREYQLGLTVEDFTQPEFYRARRKAFWGGGQGLAAAPGLLNIWQILPPNGSVLTVVDRVIIANGANDAYRIGITLPSATGTPRVARSLDSRNSPTGAAGNPNSTFQSDQVAASVLGSGAITVRSLASDTLEIRGPWILSPASPGALVVEQNTPNAGGLVSFIWTERHAVDSELR